MKIFFTSFKAIGEQSLALFLFLACLMASLSVQAQKECGFDRMLEQRISEDPAVREYMEQMEAFTRKYIASADKSAGTVIIPTVVHVVHNGEAVGTYPNMSDAQINSAILNLNQAFQNTAPYASSMFYNSPMDVEFVLAKRTSQGAATTGIERHDVTSKSYGATYNSDGISSGGAGVPQSILFADYYWNPQDYMNIWLVKKIDGIDTGSGASGTLGYATLPGTNPAVNDGLVCQARAFGYYVGYDHATRPADFDFGPSPSHLNGTADHEVGHYLNLHHTFNGDNNGTTCPPASGTIGTNDDGCADIAPHKRTDSVCPADSPTGNDCTGGDNQYIHNFMNYSTDECFQGFSGDQKTRCEAALNGPRAAFMTSLGATAPAAGTYPAAYAASPTQYPQPNSGIYSVSFNGVTVKSLSTVHAGNYLDRTATQETFALEYNTMYSMSIIAGVLGGNPEIVGVFIDYNGDGDMEDAGERVFQAAASDGKAGTAHTATFTTPMAPASLPNNRQQLAITPRLRMRIMSDFASGSQTINTPQQALVIGQTQDFSVTLAESVLPVELVRLEATPYGKSVELNWETATEESNEGFTVQRSVDGVAFTDIGFVAGAGDSDVAVRYNFNDGDVRPGVEYYYRLSQRDFVGTTTNSDVVSATMKDSEGVAIFPNPATAELFISRGNGQEGTMSYEVFSTLGQRVAEGQTTDVTARVDVTKLVAGSYFVRISAAGQETETKRIVVRK